MTASRGSSPLARGLPRGRPPRGGPRWIIPARAGFTCAVGYGVPERRDHPRSRGVYCCCWPIFALFWGSSPLARGLPRPGVIISRARWIIPARAGFTEPISRPSATVRDHPRSRGVYCDCGRFVAAQKDHPRSRGVYVAPQKDSRADSGSSPLARGLRQTIWIGPRRLRIIPARAGFTYGRIEV